MRRLNKSDLPKVKKKTKLRLKKKPAIIAASILILLVVFIIFIVGKIGNKRNVEAAASVAQEETTTEVENETENATESETKEPETEEEISLPEVETKTETETQGTASGEEYPGQKKVYLTFDDGPSANTPKILDILDEYGVKATFFTICNTTPRDIESLKRIVESGNTLAIHSVSHEYSKVYASLDSFKEDVLGMQEYLQEQTGYTTWLYRFPGGSSNKVARCSIEECKEFLAEQGFVYFDWNVSSGDASAVCVDKDVIVDNVLSEIGSKEEYVVLMHDAAAKTTTVEALPEIIESLQARGYLILPITENTKPIHH